MTDTENESETRVAPRPTIQPDGDFDALNAGGLTRQRRFALPGLRRASSAYVLVALVLIFSLWIPNTFLTQATLLTWLNDSAIVALVAVALVIPLSAGVFDLAIGAQVGIAAIVVARLLASADVPIPVAILAGAAVGAAVGAISGLLITRAHIDSFIATLGMSSVLIALTNWISGSQQILGLTPAFNQLASGQVLGLTYTFFYLILIALIVWYVLEQTPAGRRVYATGGNVEAARLAGVRTSVVIVVSLAAGGLVAGLAGVLIASRLSTGDPTIGPGYLLPAFSAAFLGSTQFKDGRFNVWGTIAAVYVLALGVKGLQLAGAPVWIPDLFNGVALLIAVGVAKARGTVKIRQPRFRRGGTQAAVRTDS